MQSFFFGLSCIPSNVTSWVSSRFSKSLSLTPFFFLEIEKALSRESVEDPEQIHEFLHKTHHTILQIPDAYKCFAPLPKMNPAYAGEKGSPKWEGIQSFYQVNLYDAQQKQEIPIDSERSISLTTRDFVSFLQRVTEAIELIALHGISHGDIRRENVGGFLPSETSYEGCITDFDHCKSFQTIAPVKQFYHYWNALERDFGVINQESDLYGLVLLIGETLLFGSSATERKTIEEFLHLYPQRIPEDLKELFPEERINRENCDPLIQRVLNLQKEGKIKEALAVQRLICESLILDKVFSLLENTFAADAQSLSQDRFIGLPKFAEIHEFIAYCREQVDWVGEYVHRT